MVIYQIKSLPSISSYEHRCFWATKPMCGHHSHKVLYVIFDFKSEGLMLWSYDSATRLVYFIIFSYFLSTNLAWCIYYKYCVCFLTMYLKMNITSYRRYLLFAMEGIFHMSVYFLSFCLSPFLSVCPPLSLCPKAIIWHFLLFYCSISI